MSARRIEIIVDNGEPTIGEVSIEVEKVEVTTMAKRDPNWEFIDANGHFHAYDADGGLPTLVSVADPVEVEADDGYAGVEVTGVDEDPDEYDYDFGPTSHLECRVCGEEIRPGITSSTFREFAPGRMSWTVVVNAEGVVGERKTVRILNGEQLLFGIGVVGNVRDDHGRPALVIYGEGELGKRGVRQRAGG